MCDQTEIQYMDGDVVWVKLGSCWWPGAVVAPDKLPPDVLPSFRKPPIAVVKFFQEDTFEYVKNINAIYKYNCSRKHEFIKKGLDMYRSKHAHMEMFPEDVVTAETATNGDPDILNSEEFQETKKESYAGLFGDSAKRSPMSASKRGRGAKNRMDSSHQQHTPIRKISKGNPNYKVHILLQGSKSTPSDSSTPSTSRAGSESADEKQEKPEKKAIFPTTPVMSSSGVYACHACSFSTSRLNVMILHNKTHSVTFMPYTPSPVRKKPDSSSKSPLTVNKTPKARKPKKDKVETEIKKPKNQKRSAEPLETATDNKKSKTDEEIKTSLLADWDDGDEDNDEEVSEVKASSPTPVATDLPETSLSMTNVSPPKEPSIELEEEKPQSSDSQYEFCEDEDWPIEADLGRKIPRVKRNNDKKSVSIDEDNVAKEVADLLSKTTVPELPAAPEPLKAEENFPEPSLVKSPDKQNQEAFQISDSNEKSPVKTIFKTKTFFRSRHTRSQDAIGKYVAEQLNAAERLNTPIESDINGTKALSSPEERESPIVELVKAARLAPKIQLKKMKAEAAQLAESEQSNSVLNTCLEEILPKVEKSTNIEIIKPIETHKAGETVQIETVATEATAPNINTEKEELVQENVEHIIETETEDITPDLNIANEEVIQEEVENVIEAENVIEPESLVPDVIDNDEKVLELLVSQRSPLKLKATPPKVYMSESTASAVDALLSVSREADRVTETVSTNLPDDLFEDDIKSNVNGQVVSKPEIIASNGKDIICNNQVENKVLDSKQVCLFNGKQQSNENSSNTSMDLNSSLEEKQILEDENPENNTPSESDLQIAEALMNLPSTALKNKARNDIQNNMNLDISTERPKALNKEMLVQSENKKYETNSKGVETDAQISQAELTTTVENDNDVQTRFETEKEKSENLFAAQSLVQMSETVDHSIPTVVDAEVKENSTISPIVPNKKDVVAREETENTLQLQSNVPKSTPTKGTLIRYETTPSKLLKILEEPSSPKVSVSKVPAKIINTSLQSCEKILNFDVANSALKTQSPKQKIIIRRTTPSKSLINNTVEAAPHHQEKIILSRTNSGNTDASAVQTFTIQASREAPPESGNAIVIQQKLRKVCPPPKLTKVQQPPLLPISQKPVAPATSAEETLFDINSMPVVLSDDILTPENIDKMPIVMSDGNIITNTVTIPGSSKPLKPKPIPKIVEKEKIVTVTSAPANKSEAKTLLVNTVHESKMNTPNILSKSTKLRGTKPMLLIDKTTGKQKIIMTKAETTVKEIKQVPAKVQSGGSAASEKFIIVPTSSAPRPARTQKIVVDPATGKTHVLVGRTEVPADNKPVSAKLESAAGGTVMVITNAQGTQSRIVLTPEHEKLLFPNKHLGNLTQIKAVTQRRPANATTNVQKQQTIVTSVAAAPVGPKLIPKQKSAIITSKGQLIVGGRVATTIQNISPASAPEMRQVAPKRVAPVEQKRIVQTIQKTSNEPLIFLQQKSGAIMQLTAAQFEHLQKTGQIVQKTGPQTTQTVKDNKVVVQKSVALAPNEPLLSIVQKQQKTRIRATAPTPVPAKRSKPEILLTPLTPSPVPPLAPMSHTPSLRPAPSHVVVPAVVSTPAPTPVSNPLSDLDNLEELLPSTAIVRKPEIVPRQPTLVIEPRLAAPVPAPAPVPEPAPAEQTLADGQLLAVPGEHFGGPAGSFYLCMEDNGTLTPIDNRPLVLVNNQLVPMMEQAQPERRDILEAALANSDVLGGDAHDAPDFRDMNANVSVHCRVSETSSVLHQPIMTPVEVPSKAAAGEALAASLEDGLAVIGVTPAVPTTLELPITVTDPRIAPRAADPLAALLPAFPPPLDHDLLPAAAKSMPLLTEDHP